MLNAKGNIKVNGWFLINLCEPVKLQAKNQNQTRSANWTEATKTARNRLFVSRLLFTYSHDWLRERQVTKDKQKNFAVKCPWSNHFYRDGARIFIKHWDYVVVNVVRGHALLQNLPFYLLRLLCTAIALRVRFIGVFFCLFYLFSANPAKTFQIIVSFYRRR